MIIPDMRSPKKIRNELIKIYSKIRIVSILEIEKLQLKKLYQNAEQNEIILLLAKGMRQKQIYKDKIMPISDKEIIKKIKSKI